MALNVNRSSGAGANKNKVGKGAGAKGGVSGTAGGSGAVDPASGGFSASLDAAGRAYTVEEIRKMINDLDVHIRSLERDPKMREFMEYRDKVRTIIGEICERLYNIRSTNVENKSGRVERTLVVIERVNAELMELENEFLAKARIKDLLAKHSEIRGLLLDIAR